MKSQLHKLYIASVYLPVIFLMVGCGYDPQSPGIEYMPDMYRSRAVEAYSEYYIGEDRKFSALKPVEGTIPRGYSLYGYENTADGYEKAGIELRNPVQCSPAILAEGELLYGKFCVHCHGTAGKGDGNVVKSKNWPGPPPAYDGPQLINIPAGKIFHSITYGKGMMGAHASQLTEEDRWKLVHYVQKLQGKKTACENVKTHDADEDGVPDALDQCPHTPGLKDYFGCPQVSTEVAEVMEMAIKGVLFNTGSAEIKEESLSILEKVKDVLLKNPNYILNVNGHTDNVGDAKSNLSLSQARAESVQAYLGSHGVEARRIHPHGYGDAKPIASNETDLGKQKNRRVEFRIIY